MTSLAVHTVTAPPTRPAPPSRSAPSSCTPQPVHPAASSHPARAGRATPDTALLHGPSRRAPHLPGGEEIALRARTEQGQDELRRVRSLAAVVAVACVEAESGRRPLRDLAGWLAPEALDKLTRRVDLLQRTGTRPSPAAAPRPLGARVCQVSSGRIEASATVMSDGRARAFALRLERRLSRWRVVSVEMG